MTDIQKKFEDWYVPLDDKMRNEILTRNVSEISGDCDEIPVSSRPCDINDFVDKEESEAK